MCELLLLGAAVLHTARAVPMGAGHKGIASPPAKLHTCCTPLAHRVGCCGPKRCLAMHACASVRTYKHAHSHAHVRSHAHTYAPTALLLLVAYAGRVQLKALRPRGLLLLLRAAEAACGLCSGMHLRRLSLLVRLLLAVRDVLGDVLGEAAAHARVSGAPAQGGRRAHAADWRRRSSCGAHEP